MPTIMDRDLVVPVVVLNILSFLLFSEEQNLNPQSTCLVTLYIVHTYE